MQLSSYLFTLFDEEEYSLFLAAPGAPVLSITQSILDKILKDTAFTVYPVWVSLHSGPTGLTGDNEVTGGSYARVQAGSSFWPSASGGVIANGTAIQFGAMPLVTVSWAGIWSAETGGTFIRGVALNYPIPLKAGNAPRFPIGSLTVTISSDFSTYLANKVLNYIFKGTAFTAAPTYWALHTGLKDDTGGNEVVGGSYARQIATIADWATTGESLEGDTLFSLDFNALVAFAGMPTTLVTQVGLWDAVSGGHFLMWVTE